MKTNASDVVPTLMRTGVRVLRPIGSGNASAAVAATRSAPAPANADQAGGLLARAATAIANPVAPRIPTGTTTGNARTVSGLIVNAGRCGRLAHRRSSRNRPYEW